MNDRELLEAAARAAGLKLADEVDSHLPGSRALWIVGPGGRDLVWQPLGDDGDALRLAVRLNMGVQSNSSSHWQSPNCTIVLFDGPVCGHRLTQKHDGDPAAATRRAIVRAAAEIAAAASPATKTAEGQ